MVVHAPSVAAPVPTLSDEALAARGLHVRRSPEGLDPTALNELFASVGFPRRDPSRLATAIRRSPALVWLLDGSSSKPAAFARANGDGVFNAVVWDVVVDPTFQGEGLGRAVMERLVGDLVSMGVLNIALYAEPQVVAFYRLLGFAADPDGIKGMVYVPPSIKKRNKNKARTGGGNPFFL